MCPVASQFIGLWPETVVGDDLYFAERVLLGLEPLQHAQGSVDGVSVRCCHGTRVLVPPLHHNDLMREWVQGTKAVPREGLTVQHDDAERNPRELGAVDVGSPCGDAARVHVRSPAACVIVRSPAQHGRLRRSWRLRVRSVVAASGRRRQV